MYTPTHFQGRNKKLIEQVILANSFGLLVTATPNGLEMTHLPFLYHRVRGENGTLRGHMAKANDHWKHIDGGESTAVFMGPHAYVSPTWYKEHESVPTWNYAAVHLTGSPRILGDQDSLNLLMEMVRAFEGPESVYDFEAGERYARKSLGGIVAFEMPIRLVNAKFKMSQNKPIGDKDRVIDRLAESIDPFANATAEFMKSMGA